MGKPCQPTVALAILREELAWLRGEQIVKRGGQTLFEGLVPGVAHLQLTLVDLHLLDLVLLGHQVGGTLVCRSRVSQPDEARPHAFTLPLFTLDKPCHQAVSRLPGALLYVHTCLSC